MKTKILLLFYIFQNSLVFGQEMIFTEQYSLLGYKDNAPIFQLYDESSRVDKTVLYTLGIRANLYGFQKVFPDVPNANEVTFIHDNIVVRGKGKTISTSSLEVFRDEQIIADLNGYGENYVFSETSNTLIVFLTRGDENYCIVTINFNDLHPEPLHLPLKGYRGYTVDDWLYFAYFHRNDGYSPYPDDIFRVKIGDWHNPELVFTSDEYDDWFLYPQSHVIATDIDLNDRETNEKNQILYNVKQETYAVVPNIKTNRSPAPAYLKYEGKYYGYYNMRDNTKGLQTIGLELLPPLPDTYPNDEGNEVLPREVWYNVPLKEKTFNGTFITPYLLREAPGSELSELDKSQLRLLRNAIYAQYGYVFNSKDLQEFYSQFEWYRMMTAKREDNDDIILLPEDKERAELIREIEAGKN